MPVRNPAPALDAPLEMDTALEFYSCAFGHNDGMKTLKSKTRVLISRPIFFCKGTDAYVATLIVLSMIVLYPAKNMAAIDAFFTAVSAGTVTGLNTHDVMNMKTYQQVAIYIVPLLGQMQFINTVVVLVRLYWFENKFKDIVKLSRQKSLARRGNPEEGSIPNPNINGVANGKAAASANNIRVLRPTSTNPESSPHLLRQRVEKREDSTDEEPEQGEGESAVTNDAEQEDETAAPEPPERNTAGHITFSPETYNKPPRDRALRIPGPREFERGQRVEEVDPDSDDGIAKVTSIDGGSAAGPSSSFDPSRRPGLTRILSNAASIERAASSAFILGDAPRISQTRSRSRMSRTASTVSRPPPNMPYLSYQPTLGRNSQFRHLTPEQRDELGGIEYRSLKLLARIVTIYYIFFHIFGAVCLLPWIYLSDIKYREYLHSIAVRPSWWAFYSALTTFNNLGFTLTPDSMVQFRETTFPMLLMIFVMWIGNTAYPCMLRFLIWAMFKIAPKESSIKEPLNFLLDHPRRCYTLLFPRGPTWMLFCLLVFLNGFDVIIFVILDLKNSEVTSISSGWHRFLAALFQATSSRTTGTSTFALAKIHPAVQFSLMVMMYISVFPIAMSIRRTNTYEESSLGIYEEKDDNESINENEGSSYLRVHVRKQFAFDLWFVFLGVFIILISEADKIADPQEDAFQVFAVFFEILSAYGNVGLSLGHPSVNTSLTGKFGTIGKLVICAMMFRGRHRGLPYEVDRAIILPREKHLTDEPLRDQPNPPIRRYHTR